ncbi:MAG: alpha/beta fold hydrolase, partial [Victivallales bacterium]|nr:alpha/beta fold hydrolase [Victivallales bacterium]
MACIRLAQNGFVVFVSDPLGQGERYQYEGMTDLGHATTLCGGHNVVERQLRLVGHSFASWRVWDNRRALDVLLSRPEVDPTHVGMTGNSGGGTLTAWTWLCEPRLTMAAPSCYITELRNFVENEQPQDGEQCPTGYFAAGMEMANLLFLRAPAPILLLGQRYDFVDTRGLRRVYENLRKYYGWLGAGDNVELFVGPCPHSFSPHNQIEAVRFFRKHCGMSDELFPREPQPRPIQETFVTPEGFVNRVGSRPVFQVIEDIAKECARTRKPLRTNEAWTETLKSLLTLPELPGQVPHYRILRPRFFAEQNCACFAVETERNLRSFLHEQRFVGDGFTLEPEAEVHLYLPHFSSEVELAEFEPLSSWNPQGPVYALDSRGLGQSIPEDIRPGGFFQPYGKDYHSHSISLQFNESFFGRRVYDVLRTLQLLQSLGMKKVHLMGHGQGGLLACYVAALSPLVQDLIVFDVPRTYTEWISEGKCDWPSASHPINVLTKFDLPEFYSYLASKLTIVSFWDSMMKARA